MDANEIYPGLWMGGHTHAREPGPAFDLRVLAAMELPHDDARLAHVAISVPLDDRDVPVTTEEATRIRDAAVLVAAEVARHHRVLVTCAAGRNRSGVVVARALMFLGYPARKAINAVRARRRLPPRLSPALGNQAFVGWLLGEEASG